MSSARRYEILYTRRAVKDIEALDSVVKRRLVEKMEALRLAPLELSQKLVNAKIGQYRYRVGDYRIVFDLRAASIVVLRIGHRREIYR